MKNPLVEALEDALEEARVSLTKYIEETGLTKGTIVVDVGWKEQQPKGWGHYTNRHVGDA